jgi:hypothetical protein
MNTGGGDSTPDAWAPYGAAAGVAAIVLFAASGVVIGDRPGFDASGAEVAAHLDAERTRIQVGCALVAALAPLLVWFLATVASVTRSGGTATRRAGTFAFGCGLAFLALFLADVTSLAVSALRPENMVAEPELAAALRDFELLAMGMAAPLASAMLAAFAVLVLRDGAVWPRWLGWLAGAAALAYALRVGTLFTVDGAFAADGVLGFWIPVIAIAAWIAIASIVLAFELRRARRAPAAASAGR